jgi:DNA-binding PadR family transcriptional regulator
VALEGFGRFSEPALLILLSLLQGERHGYGISLDLERLTGSRPGPGTLYGAISRLEGRGLIEAAPSVGRRKPYRLTPVGHAAVADEIQRLSSLAVEGQRRLHSAAAHA